MKVQNPLWTGHRQATTKALPGQAPPATEPPATEDLFVQSEGVERFQAIRARAQGRTKLLKTSAVLGGVLAAAALPFAPPQYRTVLGLVTLLGAGVAARELFDKGEPAVPQLGQRPDLTMAYQEAVLPGTPSERKSQLFSQMERALVEPDLASGRTHAQVGGMNRADLWTGTDGLTMVTKAYSGQKPGQFRKNIESLGQYGRERASYIVDRWLGHLAGVPPTVSAPEGLRTLYVPGGTPGLEDPANGWILTHTQEPEYRQLAIFDNVIGNLDRHRKNYLVMEDGQLVPIDHGLSFPTKNDEQGGHHHEFGGTVVLNEEERNRLTSFRTSRDEIARELQPHLPAEAIEAMFERVDTMLKLGRTYCQWRRE